MRAVLLSFAAAAVVLLSAPGEARAQACKINSVTLTFAGYNVFASAPTDATGSISYKCPPPLVPRISISPGSAGTYTPMRRMPGPAGDALDYNIYFDTNFSVVWGTGADDKAVEASGAATVPIYARIPAGQDVTVGVYSDTVVVTLMW
jgi:spore coat protein U-like protein